jgi:tRNA (mo5U34)-methyltransferase
MTREEILAGLKILEPWFHRIDLGSGLFTKTETVMGEPVDHPRETWEIVRQCLPADLSGKSVLDVGCNGGFYCVEAKRRAARRVLGVDGQRQHVRQALFVRKVLGLDLEFRRFSVYDLNPETVGRFDITLALGLVYHLKHLVFALERLYAVTNELLVVESAIIPPESTPKSFEQPLGNLTQKLHPIFYAENSPEAKEQVFNWFLPSPAALKALLENAGFDEVNVFSVVRDRAVLVCRKSSVAPRKSVADYVALLAFNDPAPPNVCRPGEPITFHLRATNAGRAPWPAMGRPETKGIVRLGAHLLAADEEEVEWDAGRGALRHDVAPGETAQIEFTTVAPSEPGSYIIEFDMVAEHLTWFEDFGAGVLRHSFVVRPGSTSSP